MGAANGEGENVVNLSILTGKRRMEEEEPSVMEEVNAMEEEEEDRGGDDVTAIAEAGIEQLSWVVCLIGTWRQGKANLVWVY